MIAVWSGLALLLLALSALLTAGEAAVFSVSSGRLKTLLQEGFEGAAALAQIRAQPPSLRGALHVLATTLNLVVLGIVLLVGSRSSEPGWLWTWLVGAVPTLIFFAEILPRALAGRRPVRMALVVAPVLLAAVRRFGFVFAPFIRLEAALTGRPETPGDDPSAREVREIAALGREEGMIDVEEHALVERAFRLDDLNAWDAMTPRVDMFCWKDSLTVGDIVPDLPALPHSRVPVYAESVDDITGILYVREAYERWVEGDAHLTLAELAREAFFVPGSISLAQLLRDFRGRRIHMGIVADEFGGTDGLITLEDVLEELVGEIVDETDVEEDELQQVAHDEWVAEGGVDVREVNETFGVELPQAEHRSLNGFICEEFGYVPESGELLETHGVAIEILEASDTQVLRARIRRAEAPDPATGPDD